MSHRSKKKLAYRKRRTASICPGRQPDPYRSRIAPAARQGRRGSCYPPMAQTRQGSKAHRRSRPTASSLHEPAHPSQPQDLLLAVHSRCSGMLRRSRTWEVSCRWHRFAGYNQDQIPRSYLDLVAPGQTDLCIACGGRFVRCEDLGDRQRGTCVDL